MLDHQRVDPDAVENGVAGQDDFELEETARARQLNPLAGLGEGGRPLAPVDLVVFDRAAHVQAQPTVVAFRDFPHVAGENIDDLVEDLWGIVAARAHANGDLGIGPRLDVDAALFLAQALGRPQQAAEVGHLAQVDDLGPIAALRGKARSVHLELGDLKGVGRSDVELDVADELQWEGNVRHAFRGEIHLGQQVVHRQVFRREAHAIADLNFVAADEVVGKGPPAAVSPGWAREKRNAVDRKARPQVEEKGPARLQHPKFLEAIFAGGLRVAIDERGIRLLEGHVVPHPRLGHLCDEIQGKTLGPS